MILVNRLILADLVNLMILVILVILVTQLEARPRLRPASNTSFHHPPNKHRLTQNQKTPQKNEKPMAESLKVKAKSLVCEKIDD